MSIRRLVVLLGFLCVLVPLGYFAFFRAEHHDANSKQNASTRSVTEDMVAKHELKNPDGTWKYTNALVNASSLYLQLHAHNPVNWYPWGEEALEVARRLDRPIFLSIGYSTCYWCHVMERLVFSDPQIATLMNRWFVNIKADKEERPDLDQIYMTATRLLNGNGGWPNSVFLTPDLKPFFAGTYFPPVDSNGLPGFPRVLEMLHDAWTNNRAQVLVAADRVTRVLEEEYGAGRTNTAALDTTLIERAVEGLKARYEPVFGGFSDAPKFPNSQALELLLDRFEFTHKTELLEMVAHTLKQMSMGGLQDHLAGGFHRYSTDAQWQVPHFEKMLYNQAQISRVLLHTYQLTGREEFRRTAEGILDFVRSEMTDPEGGFYAALDSETGGVEGSYYLWTEVEIREALGNKAERFFAYYGLGRTLEGEGGVLTLRFEEKNHVGGRDPDEVPEDLEPLRAELLRVRNARPRPRMDTKILAGWNGLMIQSYAFAYRVLRRDADLAAARLAVEFVLARMHDGAGLTRSYAQGRAELKAYVEDYAFMLGGLVELYRASGEQRYLDEALDLADEMIGKFKDPEDGLFFFSQNRGDLLVDMKDAQDSAIPSGNSAAALSLLSLASETGRSEYREMARRILEGFSGEVQRVPAGYPTMLRATQAFLIQSTNGQKITESDPVQVEVVLSKEQVVEGESFQVDVRVKIADGWHINANHASLDFLVPTEVQSEGPVEILSVDYPVPANVSLGFAAESLSVFTGEVMLRARVKVKPQEILKGTSDLAVVLQYQACDERRCLSPVKQRLALPVSILK